MGQLGRTPVPRKPLRAAVSAAWPGKTLPRAVLCVLPKQLRANPLGLLLPGYELAEADTWAVALRMARHRAYDLYVVHSPLIWANTLEICRRIRAFDAHTPVIVYSVHPTMGERREALGCGYVQAYVARSEDAHNLAGTAGQLIMISELRSHEALNSGVQTMQEHISRRLAKLAHVVGAGADALRARTQARLKIEACRMFAEVGGSRANFERLWPSILDGAVKRAGVTES